MVAISSETMNRTSETQPQGELEEKKQQPACRTIEKSERASNAVAKEDELNNAENPEQQKLEVLQQDPQEQTVTDNEVDKGTNSRVEAIIRKKLGRGFSDDDFDEE